MYHAASMSSTTSFDSDRRRYPRVKAKIPVEITHEDGPPLRTATDEISLCGCYLVTMFTMEVGTKVTLAFSINEGGIQARGVVATRFPQVGNGIDFVDMTQEDRLKLAQYIAASS